MFKLFKHEPGLTPKEAEDNKEDVVKSKQMVDGEALKNSAIQKELISNEEFAQGIKDAMEYVAHNGKIDPETLEMMTGLKLEDVLARLENQENLKIEMSVKDVFEVINMALDTSNDNTKENWFRKMVNRPSVKAIFVTLMLFLKFAPDSQAANVKTEDKSDNKMEQSFQQSSDIDSGNTYNMTPDDLDRLDGNNSDAKAMSSEFNKLERYSQLELSNYYDTDSDHISDANRAQIEAQMTKFLDNVNEHNFQELLDGQFKISGSSDERETSRAGGNEKLTADRIEAARQILTDVLNKYDFGDRLTKSQIEKLQNKNFELESPEGGVTHLSDLINPDTGENYTEAEIQALSEDDRLDLLKDCRKVAVDFLVRHDAKINTVKALGANIDIQNNHDLEQTLSDWQDYDEIFYIVDNSPSMKKNHEAVAKIILEQKNLKGTKINFGNFSDDLDDLKEVKSLNDIAQDVTKSEKGGSSEERVLKTLISTLKQIKSGRETSKKVIIATDENFQNLNWDELNEIEELAEDKNVEVAFIYANQDGARALDLATVKSAYAQAAWDRFTPMGKSAIETLEGKIYRAESQVKALQSAIDRITSRDNVSDQAKMLVYQEKLSSHENSLTQNRAILEKLETSLANGDVDTMAKSIRESGSKYPSPKINLNPEQADLGIALNK